MVKAGAIIRCAYTKCGVEFTPIDPRQRYHTYECGQNARIERRPNYNPGAKPGPKPRQYTPVVVLLPAGCNPIRAVALPVVTESTERIGGGHTYGEVVRRVWCARYERCLSHAVSKNWLGFDCSSCEVDEPDINAPRNPKSNWEW